MNALRRAVVSVGALIGLGGALTVAAEKGLERQEQAIVAQADATMGPLLEAIRNSTHYLASNKGNPAVSLRLAENSLRDARKAFETFKQGMPHTNQANIEVARRIAFELSRLHKALEKVVGSDETRKKRILDDLGRLIEAFSRFAA